MYLVQYLAKTFEEEKVRTKFEDMFSEAVESCKVLKLREASERVLSPVLLLPKGKYTT